MPGRELWYGHPLSLHHCLKALRAGVTAHVDAVLLRSRIPPATILFSTSHQRFFGYFDPKNIISCNTDRQFLGWTSRYIRYSKKNDYLHNSIYCFGGPIRQVQKYRTILNPLESELSMSCGTVTMLHMTGIMQKPIMLKCLGPLSWDSTWLETVRWCSAGECLLADVFGTPQLFKELFSQWFGHILNQSISKHHPHWRSVIGSVPKMGYKAPQKLHIGKKALRQQVIW